MIVISKCPYRISLLGGSTDLDWFVNRHGKGLSIGFSINAYSTIAIKLKKYIPRGILNYSSREEYQNHEDISHPIIRKCLERIPLNYPIEMSSFGDDLSGGGLGSSSSFTVSLIKSLYEINENKISNFDAAHLASEIEIKDCNQPIGRQDQYLSSLGGINILEFRKNGKVSIIKNELIEQNISNYVTKLFLVDTGLRRSAFKKLTQIKNELNSYDLIKRIFDLSSNFIDNCKKAKYENIEVLLEDSLINSWNIKKSLHGVINPELLKIEDLLETNSFKVLKLLGAGGGGYFLIKYEGNDLEKDKIKLSEYELRIHNFEIDFDGAKVWKI